MLHMKGAGVLKDTFLYRFLRSSVFGTLVHYCSGRKIFTYEDGDLDLNYNCYKEDSDRNKEETSAEENNHNQKASIDEEKSFGDDADAVLREKIIISWDGPNDPDNPYNWPLYAKCVFIFMIVFLTTSVYSASAIYTPGESQIMKSLNVSQTVAILPLTLFVIGYGLGTIAFSPMSETARLGRAPIYIITLLIFVVLQIPTALVDNIAGLSILRFISGIFASPCLATGAASIGDVLALPYMIIGLPVWGMSAVCGPALGPLVGSVLVVKAGWRWCFWFLLILDGICLGFLFLLMPETYLKTILRRKAQRLRIKTGNNNIVSEGELEGHHMSLGQVAKDILWRPIVIIFSEPVVLLIDVYIALIYAMLYLWFEAFPITFLQTKHFTLVTMGAAYVTLMVGCLLGAMIYIPVFYYLFTRNLLRGKTVTPEVFLPVAIVGSIFMPMGVFIFGWTSSKDVHWTGPLVGGALFTAGAFFEFQTLFNYLAMSFPRYMASVFAGNNLFRSTVGACFPLFAHALYTNLATEKYPVGWGSSIIGFIFVGMILIPIGFYIYGPKLRASSAYSGL